jgi:hypothetical protein
VGPRFDPSAALSTGSIWRARRRPSASRFRQVGVYTGSIFKGTRPALDTPPPIETEAPAPSPDLRLPCPCCGVRMLILEIVRPVAQARAPPLSPMPSGMMASVVTRRHELHLSVEAMPLRRSAARTPKPTATSAAKLTAAKSACFTLLRCSTGPLKPTLAARPPPAPVKAPSRRTASAADRNPSIPIDGALAPRVRAWAVSVRRPAPRHTAPDGSVAKM